MDTPLTPVAMGLEYPRGAQHGSGFPRRSTLARLKIATRSPCLISAVDLRSTQAETFARGRPRKCLATARSAEGVDDARPVVCRAPSIRLGGSFGPGV